MSAPLSLGVPEPPITSGIKARNLPELRQKVVNYLAGEHAQSFWKHMADNGMFFGHTPIHHIYGHGDDLRVAEIERWQKADLYYVTADMTIFAIEAAASLPSFNLMPEDVPSEYGVIVFEKPIRFTSPKSAYTPEGAHTVVVACAWGQVTDASGRRGVWMSWWADQDYTLKMMGALGKFSPQQIVEIRKTKPLHIGYDDETVWYYGQNTAGSDDSNALIQTMKTLRATWLLMQQEVASVPRLIVSKVEQREMKRRGFDPASVRMVTLRRQRSTGKSKDKSQVQHDHRWTVKGHWRRQWYSSRNEHVPIWIQPQIRGPQDKPLVARDIVRLWRR